MSGAVLPIAGSNTVQGARGFRPGDRVKIAKKTRVVDKERGQEGAKPGELPPVDVDITGVEGTVQSGSYVSPSKGEVCVPIELPNGAIVSVPEGRLDKRPDPVPSGSGGITVVFNGPPNPEGLAYLRELTKKQKDKVRQEKARRRRAEKRNRA